MSRVSRISILLLAALCLVVAVDARPLPTELAGNGDPLNEGAVVSCSPLTMQAGGALGSFILKKVNVPKMVDIKDLGYLAQALSNQALQAAPTDPKGFHAQTVIPYLNKSKEMVDSLKLRRAARQIRAEVVAKVLSSPEAGKLSAEQKEAIKSFFNRSVGSPLVILDRSPLPKFMPEPGPCMIPLGVERVEGKTNQPIGLETSAICILDIDGLFSVKQAMDNDTLDIVVAHENAHAIQFDMYGKAFQSIKRISTNGHDAPYITDTGLAYTEGWAEAFEAVYGPANPKFAEKDRKKYNISEFLFARQDPIRRDRYVWLQAEGKKTGAMKNALQMLSTEGVIAGLFYDILSSKSITAPFDKCVTVMVTNQPLTFQAFVESFVKLYPEDKKVVYRILLETTNYVTMRKEAAKLYQEYYQARVGYVQKKVEKAVFDKAKQAFTSFKEDLFAKAMNGSDPFANVGAELWFSGQIKLDKKLGGFKGFLAKKLGQDGEVWKFNLDLNTISEKGLMTIGLDQADAAALIAEREAAGSFSGDPLQVLEQKLGAQKFAAIRAKAQLTTYKPAQTAEGQAVVLYPEDFEK